MTLCCLQKGRLCIMDRVRRRLSILRAKGFPCPQFVNPADHFFMEVLQEKNVPALKEAWKNRPNSNIQYNPLTSSKPVKRAAVSFWTQFAFLLKRSSRKFIRNRMILPLKLTRAIFFGSLIAAIYSGSNSDEHGCKHSKPCQLHVLFIDKRVLW